MRSVLKLKMGLAAAAMAFSVPTGASAQEHHFVLHHMLSNMSPAHRMMLVPWAERVAEMSDGRIEIEVNPSMSLGGTPPELISQARDGVVDLIWTVAGYTPGLHPRSEVIELPGIFPGDARAAGLTLYDMYDDLADDFAGLEVMWLHTHGGHAIQTRDRLVRSPADVQGLNLRTPSRTGAWIIEAWGGNAVATSVPELPQALSRGEVDGALIPFEIIPPLQLQEQTQYQIEGHDGMRFGTILFHVSMNQARWDSLPEDIQQIFRDATTREWWGEVGEIWEASEEGGLGYALEDGNDHVVLSEEETAAMLAALTPVVDRWIEDMDGQGIDGAALVERARELVEQNRQ
ncbi:TRAP transporter substrate-binding protein [Alkalilacustris brevis]|uniref:TRAP transporter substrate-binding protein n=1 Tax=Alkalilacustris brevis TaxID=2026338 RepID=UPI001EE407B0|nr:TRAP transporter substrate-binding protein [Alkalilacustris brevis]